MTCQEFKDSVSFEALQKFKLENGIKDCPKCTTSLYKIEGCNHMVCRGCSVHICWVCLETFNIEELCYTHMNEIHGGNGLDADYIPSDDEDEPLEDPAPNDIPVAAFLEGALEMAEEIVALPFRMPGQWGAPPQPPRGRLVRVLTREFYEYLLCFCPSTLRSSRRAAFVSLTWEESSEIQNDSEICRKCSLLPTQLF